MLSRTRPRRSFQQKYEQTPVRFHSFVLRTLTPFGKDRARTCTRGQALLGGHVEIWGCSCILVAQRLDAGPADCEKTKIGIERGVLTWCRSSSLEPDSTVLPVKPALAATSRFASVSKSSRTMGAGDPVLGFF